MPAPSTQHLDHSLRLSKAASLASEGRYSEAELLLAPDGRASQDALILQAQAALATRSGDYSRGMHLWQMLLQRDPGNDEAQRMINSIDLWLSRPTWFRYLPAGAAVFATLLIGLLILSAASGSSSKPAPATAAVPRGAQGYTQPGYPSSYPTPAYSSQAPASTPAYTPTRASAPEPSISISLPPAKSAKKK